jgi:hypothetical protein
MLANIQMQKTGSVIASRGVSSLPASDLERWTDWVSNKPQQVEFADILMSKNSQPITNWAIQHTCHV